VNCDVDGDGSLATGTCGGTDCDDNNADVHPGQVAFFTKATMSGSFDYDCNGQSEPQYASPLDCTAITLDCVGEGFADQLPPCGKSGKWARCNQSVPPLPLCEEKDDGKQTMACR